MPQSQTDVGKLFELLRTLVVPDERPRVLPTLLRRLRPLPRPMTCLVVTDLAQPSPLPEVHAWLGTGRGRAAPRALINVATLDPDAIGIRTRPFADYLLGGEEAPEHCLPILEKLSTALSSDDTAMGPIRFPRYRTADWITRQHVMETQSDIAAAELRRRLPRLLRRASYGEHVGSMGGFLGDTVTKLLIAVLSLWPVLRLWLWVGGVVPGLSRETRWFMHQRYLAPELSDSFLGFATRLTDPHRERENSEQVAKLLVHAFLADLRDAYRRRIWKPSSWRRTAYPVALLDNVEADGPGANLLRWINEIRNETGVFDPLVVFARLNYPPYGEQQHELDTLVAHTERPPLHEPHGEPERPANPDPLLQWQYDITDMRRNRWAYAWLLLMRLPGDARLSARDRAYLAHPPAPPLAARRWFVALAVLVPVLALVATALVYIPPLRGESCSQWPWAHGIAVEKMGRECVGYSDNGDLVFSSDDGLIAMQREVFEQNKTAKRIKAENPRRQLISLVYFAGLTYMDNTRYPRGVVEELAGLAVRQRKHNSMQEQSEPLLRIIVANGGSNMQYASAVVTRQLSGLLRAEPGILGVIGLDRSTEKTKEAIGKLGVLGVPVVSTVLSVAEFAEASPMYLSATPSNNVQARLVADYIQGARFPENTAEAGQPRYNRVVVYYPTIPDDIYVNTLIRDVTREFGERQIPMSTFTWATQDILRNAPRPCRTSGFDRRTLLFFAGRSDDFGAFAKAVTDGCNTDDLPSILGGDTVTRLIADPNTINALPPSLTVRYVAKGARVILGGRRCVDGEAQVGSESDTVDFEKLCNGLHGLVESLAADPAAKNLYHPNWPGDRTGLAYDVAGVFEQAVAQAAILRPGDVGGTMDRTAVALTMRRDYPGVTGLLRFSGRQVAEDTGIGILVSVGVKQVDQPQRCLLMSPRDEIRAGRGPDGCPAGAKSFTEDWVPRP
ncbi:ABC transporter substrate-binding protein [Nocardia sp. NPDC052566]|uniref:ABC transporter substrate-binding protein n=1 Tax=Nocardia sp. NPDC052566 TaxID=3364330 RepID=UPI0037CA9B18